MAVEVMTSCFAQAPILMELRFRDRDDLSSRYDLELQGFVRKEILWRLCSIFSETFYQAWLSVASRKLTFGSQSGVSRLVGGKTLPTAINIFLKIQWIFPSDLGEVTLADKDANSRLVSNVDTEESVDQRLVTAWQHFCNSFSQFDQKHTVCFFVFVQSLNSQMWCAFSNVTNVFVWLEKCIFLCYITPCCRKWP